MSCNHRRPVEYRPVSDQVFLVPKGAGIRAPDGRFIISDSKGERIELEAVILPYDGVIISDGAFHKLVRAKIEGKEE